eukprot:g18280.t1
MEPEEMGEVLKEYFASVFVKEKYMDDGKIREGYIDIKKEEVLKNIRVNKTLGPNGIYPRRLKEKREEIVGVLTEIFVSSSATDD